MKTKNKVFVLIFCLIYEVQCGIERLEVNRDLVIPQYISTLIRSATDQDSSRNHDVVIIRLEKNASNDVFRDIVTEILKVNVYNSVYAQEGSEQIQAFRVHTASFIIIVSDIFEKVS